MFTIKKVWDRVCGPENQFFDINSCKWLSTSSLKVSAGPDEVLPIYLLIPSTCPAHDVTNFIDSD